MSAPPDNCLTKRAKVDFFYSFMLPNPSIKRANSINIMLPNPSKKQQYLQMADINPSQLLKGEVPHLIDEWQLAPKLWDAVRFEVDQRDDFGQFILTGSAVPPESTQISHTGTGRIAKE